MTTGLGICTTCVILGFSVWVQKAGRCALSWSQDSSCPRFKGHTHWPFRPTAEVGKKNKYSDISSFLCIVNRSFCFFVKQWICVFYLATNHTCLFSHIVIQLQEESEVVNKEAKSLYISVPLRTASFALPSPTTQAGSSPAFISAPVHNVPSACGSTEQHPSAQSKLPGTVHKPTQRTAHTPGSELCGQNTEIQHCY